MTSMVGGTGEEGSAHAGGRGGAATADSDRSRLHVALNLVYLVPGEIGGMETYARELIPRLAADPDLRLTCLVNREAAALGGGPWGEVCPMEVVPVERAQPRRVGARRAAVRPADGRPRRRAGDPQPREHRAAVEPRRARDDRPRPALQARPRRALRAARPRDARARPGGRAPLAAGDRRRGLDARRPRAAPAHARGEDRRRPAGGEPGGAASTPTPEAELRERLRPRRRGASC